MSSLTHNPGEPFDSVTSAATVVDRTGNVDEAGYKSAIQTPPQSYGPSSSRRTTQFQNAEILNSEHKLYGDEHVQFATYKGAESFSTPKLAPPPVAADQRKDVWIPLPLRAFFWIPLIVVLTLGAIALEVVLYYSHKNQGFSSGQTERDKLALHYAYTLPPVIVASLLVAMWASTDAEIKKMQPYVDLVHGDSPPKKSLLLDYTRYNSLMVWGRAAMNRHYLVALASLMVILTLSFQPLASALLSVREIWWQEPDMTVQNLKALGLNQNIQFNDLTYFMAGAGYSGASLLYTLPQPPFTKSPYTVAPFQLPTSVTTNGTALANTTAIKTETGCVTVPVNMVKHSDGTGWTNNATYNQCSISFEVDVSSRILFGSDLPICDPIVLPEFSPVVFWYFSYIPSARAAASFCSPKMSFLEVNVAVDVSTGNITKVTELRPFSTSSPFSSSSSNVTGAPLNGQAYNGLSFNLTNPDRFVLARQNATRLQLPAAVYAATDGPQGFSDSFNGDLLTQLTDKIYGVYLTLISREIYFLPNSEPITVQVRTFRNRVFMSDVATHLLAVAMLVLAFFATIVHVFHREDRRFLRLAHEPGTIASAVSIGAQTGVAEVLADRQGGRDMKEALRNKKFRFDPTSNKIVMEGEAGYEDPASPAFRRHSVMTQILHRPRRQPSLEPSSSGVSAPTTPDFRLPHTPKSQSKTSPLTPTAFATASP
ncbi:hypothetical protein CPB83DRAFT_865412 [Crepidotus variabilis]|uniref:Transmembrane protein n=1 Tax=Crepidotus variabilis TaxID=179855 RepID=A0A9P6E2Z9_9AGAR|nr:hypothetical protein CPB83DRAFT_865412 [Crepidotus variabilis]